MNQQSQIRQQAIDETKQRGDPLRAVALAIVYLADVVRGLGSAD